MQSRSSNQASGSSGGIRLGGVRADFVAGLGQHLKQIETHVQALRAAPTSTRLRDELRRQIHALGVRARVLHFDTTAARLDETEQQLHSAAEAGGVDAHHIDNIEALLADLPSTAWHEVGQTNDKAAQQPHDSEQTPSSSPWDNMPVSVLLLGEPSLRKTLEQGSRMGSQGQVDCEQAQANQEALVLARVLAPDVVVLDADETDALGWATEFRADPLTEAIPLVVVGSWSRPEQAAFFIQVGASKTLPKPISPNALWSSVKQALVAPHEPTIPAALGTLNVEQLADTLARELQTGIVDAVEPDARKKVIDLGDGTEVQAAVWSAIARVREMLTIQSMGAIRFSTTGPAGVLTAAPWLKEPWKDGQDRRLGGREPNPESLVSLEGVRVLIIDDDPAVRWFLRDLLRTHGAETKQAEDGREGLAVAHSFAPELVITDIIMPHLDGFALTRALKQDVLLRDVPVVLLSWKEDLLERLRDVGAGADGYLRKEASSGAVLRTIQEALRSRSRVEQRVREQPRALGRLDGLTAITLLKLVIRARHEASVSVRDARHLYEVSIKDGRIVHLVRTSLDGSFLRGEEALVSMLSVSQGRFQVDQLSDTSPSTTYLELEEVLRPIVSRMRQASHYLVGSGKDKAGRVVLRFDRLETNSLPKSQQEFFKALDGSESPSQLLASSKWNPEMVVQLLVYAINRGAVMQVLSEDGTNLIDDTPVAQNLESSEVREEGHDSLEPRPRLETDNGASTESPGEDEPDTADESDEPAASQETQEKHASKAPSSLEEAVMREVAGRDAGDHAPIVDATSLRPRSGGKNDLPSWSSEQPDVDGTDAVKIKDSGGNVAELPMEADAPKDENPENGDDVTQEAASVSNSEETATEEPKNEAAGDEEDDEEEVGDGEQQGHVSGEDRETGPKLTLWILGALAAGSLLGWYVWFGHPAQSPEVANESTTQTAQKTSDAAVAPSQKSQRPQKSQAAPEASTGSEASQHFPDAQEDKDKRVQTDLPLEKGSQIAPNVGVLEVVTGKEGARVNVDKMDVGRGKVSRVVLEPGWHDVVVTRHGKRAVGRAPVKAGTKTRLNMEGSWRP